MKLLRSVYKSKEIYSSHGNPITEYRKKDKLISKKQSEVSIASENINIEQINI